MFPQPAGCSGTPLPQKLGIKPGHRVAFVHAPDDFARALGALPDGVVQAADDRWTWPARVRLPAGGPAVAGRRGRA